MNILRAANSSRDTHGIMVANSRRCWRQLKAKWKSGVLFVETRMLLADYGKRVLLPEGFCRLHTRHRSSGFHRPSQEWIRLAKPAL
jgi:hypothetical protein